MLHFGVGLNNNEYKLIIILKIVFVLSHIRNSAIIGIDFQIKINSLKIFELDLK